MAENFLEPHSGACVGPPGRLLCPYPSTIQDKLRGTTAPTLEHVLALVEACAKHADSIGLPLSDDDINRERWATEWRAMWQARADSQRRPSGATSVETAVVVAKGTFALVAPMGNGAISATRPSQLWFEDENSSAADDFPTNPCDLEIGVRRSPSRRSIFPERREAVMQSSPTSSWRPRTLVLSALRAEYLAMREHLADLRDKEHEAGTRYEVGRLKGSQC